MARRARIENSTVVAPTRVSQRSSAAIPISNTPAVKSPPKRRRNAPAPKYSEVSSEEEKIEASSGSHKLNKRKRNLKDIKDESSRSGPPIERDSSIDNIAPPAKSNSSRRAAKHRKLEKVTPHPQQESIESETAASTKHTKKAKKEHPATGKGSPKPKRRRKTKEEKEAEKMPIAARTLNSNIFIGAHVSAAGGVHNSVTNAVHIGGNAFALFLKSQRKWENPPIKPEHANEFKQLCSSHSYNSLSHVVPHGSYLVNLASKDPEKGAQAYKGFLDDIQRAESLGIKLYNFHPGNTNGEPRQEAIARIAEHLNAAHKATSTVVTLLENMAANPAGNTIGGKFEDLRDIIDLVDDKSRVGICLDTCHAFAAGYDLRAPTAFKFTLSELDRIVGLPYLRAVHMNDSKAPFGAHRDLHQGIGLGFLGLQAFHNLVNEPAFRGLPLILETPIDRKDENGKDVEDKSVWAREIKLLESLVGMDAESKEFRQLENELADKGAEERQKYQLQFEKKMAKHQSPKKKKKKVAAEVEDKSSESESE